MVTRSLYQILVKLPHTRPERRRRSTITVKFACDLASLADLPSSGVSIVAGSRLSYAMMASCLTNLLARDSSYARR